jgi:hypothetical protein
VVPKFTIIAAWGALIIGAIYMLRAVRNLLHGPLSTEWSSVSDADLWRKIPFVILLASLLIFGCFPSLLTNKIKSSAEAIVAMANKPPPVVPGIHTASMLSTRGLKVGRAVPSAPHELAGINEIVSNGALGTARPTFSGSPRTARFNQ